MTISLSHIRTATRNRSRAVPLGTYLAVWRQRRELAQLDPERLQDIGISRSAAAAEAARPFWDIPPSQHR